MELQELLRDLVNLVETTAPHIWEIAIRQVYVDALSGVFFFIPIFVFFILLLFLSKHCWYQFKNENDDDFLTLFVLTFLSGLVILGLSFLPLRGVIGRLINPEYYAIELLINYVK